MLDEPAAGMNPQETDQLMLQIKRLKELGFTVLVVEHDMKLVMNISDRIYVMEYGKEIAQGTPQQIIDNAEVRKVYLGEHFRM